jgi:hypothetical protein
MAKNFSIGTRLIFCLAEKSLTMVFLLILPAKSRTISGLKNFPYIFLMPELTDWTSQNHHSSSMRMNQLYLVGKISFLKQKTSHFYLVSGVIIYVQNKMNGKRQTVL